MHSCGRPCASIASRTWYESWSLLAVVQSGAAELILDLHANVQMNLMWSGIPSGTTPVHKLVYSLLQDIPAAVQASYTKRK